ncbi:MAG TPA: hypothetical protein PK325_08135 [Cyclobacteriaceae bacterium]|nr:OB-fold putative lipoprotein [Cyclobacteriaceae bacterium]HMV08522.1 hypothetical protein [Cyclobacteriaceae bacterium]HMV90010.1 hypothetical protein [Cyclobacteriaceae bacterium]HMX01295.1 hypothetical protein [Cyclobacteriaceae bacterium]HMX51291.1 hypothetical protein [Cyclobacteriaceae bacterium]
MKTKRLAYTIAVAAGLTLLIAGFAFYAIFFKPHRSVEDETAIAVTAGELFNDFATNEPEANKRYLDKAVEVTGEVMEVTSDMQRHPVVILATNDILFGVRCTMAEEHSTLKAGDAVAIKGICKGFLSDVIITDGILLVTDGNLNEKHEK